jgi:hypothetical protein
VIIKHEDGQRRGRGGKKKGDMKDHKTIRMMNASIEREL